MAPAQVVAHCTALQGCTAQAHMPIHIVFLCALATAAVTAARSHAQRSSTFTIRWDSASVLDAITHSRIRICCTCKVCMHTGLRESGRISHSSCHTLQYHHTQSSHIATQVLPCPALHAIALHNTALHCLANFSCARAAAAACVRACLRACVHSHTHTLMHTAGQPASHSHTHGLYC